MKITTLFLMSFSLVAGVLASDEVAPLELRIVRVHDQAVMLDFRAERAWQLDQSSDLRGWRHYASGGVGAHHFIVELDGPQAFFRLSSRAAAIGDGRDREKEHPHKKPKHHKKPKKEHH